MRYDEIMRLVTSSAPQDWEVISQGPLYLDWLQGVFEGKQRSLEVETHPRLAIYKPDVSLRLAWGLTLEDELSFEGWTFPDPSIARIAVDAFWQGALVARWTLLRVDGGKSYLPDPDRMYVTTGEPLQGYESIGRTAKASEVALARLANDLLHRPAGEFDSYFQQTGIIEVPDE